IVLDAAFRVGSLLMTDDHRRTAIEPPDAADDRLVLAKIAVAGKRREILHEAVDVMAEMRSLGGPRDLRLLPGAELGISLLQSLARLGLELGELFLNRDGALLGCERSQLGDLAFKLGNGLFEIEISAHLAKDCPSNPLLGGPPRIGRRERGC